MIRSIKDHFHRKTTKIFKYTVSEGPTKSPDGSDVGYMLEICLRRPGLYTVQYLNKYTHSVNTTFRSESSPRSIISVVFRRGQRSFYVSIWKHGKHIISRGRAWLIFLHSEYVRTACIFNKLCFAILVIGHSLCQEIPMLNSTWLVGCVCTREIAKWGFCVG